MLSGKGWWIWQVLRCDEGNPDAIARAAVEAGLGHVLIKVADGPVAFNLDPKTRLDWAAPVVQALKNAGIPVWGWHYVYGNDPLGEANMALRRADELELDGYVIDAEAEYKGRANAAKTLMNQLHLRMTIPLGLSSYRYPSYHMELPWKEFLTRCDLVLPQVYWMQAHDPGKQLKRSWEEFRAMALSLPIVPTGAAFREHGWEPTAEEVKEFLDTAKGLHAPAVNFWEWSDARVPERRHLWDVVADYAWPGSVQPPPDPPPADLHFRLKVVQDGLNVRTGPGTNFAMIGKLRAGQVVDTTDIGGSSAWVEFAFEGKRAWANVQNGLDRNMEPMK